MLFRKAQKNCQQLFEFKPNLQKISRTHLRQFLDYGNYRK